MKAVILERKGGDAAVLAENGTFLKLRHTGNVGDEIEVAAPSPIRIYMSNAAKILTAAALVLALIGGSYHYMDVSVSAYVSIDADGSSVEMTVNRLGKVTSVRPVAESDSELAETLSANVSGMRVEDAVNAALNTLREKGKVSSDGEPAIVGITSESEDQADNLENAIISRSEIIVRMVRVSEDERVEAHEQDIGGGLYVYGTENIGTDEPQYEEAANTEDGDNEAANDGASFTEPAKEEPPFVNNETPTNDNTVPTEEHSESVPPSSGAVPPQNGQVDSAQAPDVDIQPPQNEQLPENAAQDITNTREQAAASPEDTTQQGERIPDEAPQNMPDMQNGTAPAPNGDVQPPQNGKQPDNMPPEQFGGQSGQNGSAPAPSEGAPPELPQGAPNAMTPPDMFGNAASGQIQ